MQEHCTIKNGNRRFLTTCGNGLVVALLLVLPQLGTAQQIFRSVGPDGRITFSDVPQPHAPQSPITLPTVASEENVAKTVRLPYELARIVAQYPVTLYTASNCSACESARKFLDQRGVPFRESTISSNQDIAALQSLSGQTSVPMLTVGAQHAIGFSDAAWQQELNAAGYPARSQLPAGYRNPAARPLTSVQEPVAAPTPEKAKPVAASALPPRPQRPSRSNPAGIQF